MKRTKTHFLFFILFALLTGCIDLDLKVKVKPNGSGTIEETVIIGTALMEILSSFTALDEDTSKLNSFDIMDEQQLKHNAQEIGENVTYIKSERIIKDEKRGYKAYYTFKNIKDIKLNEDPSGKLPSEIENETESSKENDFITFGFQKGELSTLIIKMPRLNEDSSYSDEVYDQEDAADSLELENANDYMKMLLKDFKVTIKVEIEGDIVETNASYLSGSEIKLLEIDLGRFLKENGNINKISMSRPKTINDLKKLIKEIPGFKLELNENVKVVFK